MPNRTRQRNTLHQCSSMRVQVLGQAGWQLEQAASRAQIAHEIWGGQPEGKCDFETSIGQGRDRYAVFVVASN
jgi:hypothetical protein